MHLSVIKLLLLKKKAVLIRRRQPFSQHVCFSCGQATGTARMQPQLSALRHRVKLCCSRHWKIASVMQNHLSIIKLSLVKERWKPMLSYSYMQCICVLLSIYYQDKCLITARCMKVSFTVNIR